MRGADIERDGDVWIYRPREHKTQHHGRERVIAIGRRGQEVLEAWLREDSAEYLFRPDESEAVHNARRRAARRTPRWPSHDPELRRRRRGRKRSTSRLPGERYTQNSYRRAVERGILAAAIEAYDGEHGREAHLSARFRRFRDGFAARRTRAELAAWRRENGREAEYADAFLAFLAGRRWTPHQLRHAFATRARAAFDNWDPVRAALGHSSAETTLEYARLELAKASRVAERLG